MVFAYIKIAGFSKLVLGDPVEPKNTMSILSHAFSQLSKIDKSD